MAILDFLHNFDYYLTGMPEAFPWFIVLLLGTGIFITWKLGFIQVRRFWHAVRVVMGHFDDPDDEGDVTHFQALTVALSATVGVGNIAGVALAIHYGGPGAVFWMWMTAVFGMALKFSECTLSLKYRVFDVNGDASGGPMYYMEKGLGQKWAGVFFASCAVICSFGTGNMNQSNTIASLFAGHPSLSSHLIGLLIAFFVGVVIIGGVKRIASVTEKLAPSMALLYFAGAGTIVLMHIEQVPGVVGSILSGAFNPQSAFGGTAAGLFVFTLMHGVRRGLFSNEAGQGSAAIAHASAKTNEPVREGVVAMTGPFIDTLVICTLTAMAILVTGTWKTRYPQTLLPGAVTVCREVIQGKAIPLQVPEVSFLEGVPQGFALFRNHATIEGAVARVGETPFTGTLKVAEGQLEGAPEGFLLQGRGLLVGAPLTAMAFRQGLAKVTQKGDLIVTLSVLLFALSTIISWSYYGDRSFVYLFGAKHVIVYRLLYLFFVYVGAVAALEAVWIFGDIALSLMAIPNLMAILLLHKQVQADAQEYFSREHVPIR
jgi:AGCS family alanine or glycine:cation symporter